MSVKTDRMKKAEIHCHLDGTLEPAALREAIDGGYDIGLSADALDGLTPIRDAQQWDWSFANGYWKVAGSVHNDRMLPFLLRQVRLWVSQNVDVAEILLCGALGGEISEVEERLSKFREAVDHLAEGKCRVGFIAPVGRARLPQMTDKIRRAIEFGKTGLLCGIAVAGDEAALPVKEFGPLLLEARDAGLGIEIHAGEFLGPESVRDALDYGRPHRLGHAIAAFKDPRLVERIAKENIHVEFCPTSNLVLSGVKTIQEHPLVRARSLGVRFSVNTDDPGAFGCSMNSEFELLERELGWGGAEFAQVYRDTVEASFIRG